MAADALGTILFDEKKLPKMTDPAEIKIEEPGAFVALVSTDLTKSVANFKKNCQKKIELSIIKNSEILSIDDKFRNFLFLENVGIKGKLSKRCKKLQQIV